MLIKDSEQKPVEIIKPVLKDSASLQREFLEMVESKLKRSEKDVWYVKNYDHLDHLNKKI